MLFFWTFVVAAVLGYVFGHYIKPNRRLRKALQEARQICMGVLEEGNKGVYRTTVTDHNQTSELVVEVKELAVTRNGQAKVTYTSAYYKNPSFRTSKGESLLREVRDLLGDYLPVSEIEWYENTARHQHIQNQLDALDFVQRKQLRD